MTSQRKPIVSFLGPVASYSHQAVRQAFSESTWELQPAVTIDDVFDQVQGGKVQAGVVPFENSTNGSVVFTLDNLADRANRYPDITVDGETYVDVHHCLVGHKKILLRLLRTLPRDQALARPRPRIHHPRSRGPGL
ncbi:prephenate dehydratase [Fusarium solani]